MKKIYLALSMILATSAVMGQQRTVLVEEYTNASCGPCAAQNPAFNTLLDANTTKVVSIKYQTDWPGTDPMNAQNPTDVDTRVAYYAVNGVPYARMDGVEFTGGSYAGAPANATQAKIDTRYAVASPFSIATTFTVSSDKDSIYATCVVTAVSAVNDAALKLHFSLIEKTINFATPPGSNGETEFFNVMRKMYPDANGSTLQAAWTVGQSQTFNFNFPIPTYIYDKSELALLAFVQTNGTKEVHQAKMTDVPLFTIDAKALNITGIPEFSCASSVNATYSFKNSGQNALTAGTITVKVNGTQTNTQPWSGNVAPGQTGTATINNIPVTPGSNAVEIAISATGDLNTANDKVTVTANTASAPQVLPIAQGFEAVAFPPTNWILVNPDAGATWQRRTGVSGFGTSTASMRMFFFSSGPGEVDDIYLPKLDLSNAVDAKITMSHAAAQYTDASTSPTNDRVQIQASTDCGANWTTVWDKAGAALATAAATSSSYGGSTAAPVNAADWKKDTVSLGAFAGQTDVLVRFHAISDYGNNAWFDDINITQNSVGIDQGLDSKAAFTMFPNPATNMTNIALNLKESANITIEIYNNNGQVVYSANAGKLTVGEHTIAVSTENLANGVYMMSIKADETSSMQMLNVAK